MHGTAAYEVERLNSITSGQQPEIILDLQKTLQTNRILYARELKAACEFANTYSRDYRIAICESRRPASIHERTYIASKVNEVAVLMPNDHVGYRDIILQTISNQLQRISELHRAYDTQQYPLLIPHDTDGRNLELKFINRYKISQLQYYCFHFCPHALGIVFCKLSDYYSSSWLMLIWASAVSEERAESPEGRLLSQNRSLISIVFFYHYIFVHCPKTLAKWGITASLLLF